MLRFVRAFAISAALIASTASAGVPPTQPDQALQRLEGLLEYYKSVSNATSNGYTPTNECVRHPSLGAMGYHYVNRELLGLTAPVNGKVNGTSTYIGVEPPAILLYAPDGHGGRKLAGIEILVFAAAWDAENQHPPMYRGRTFKYMADDPTTLRDEAHGFMPHYDLHIWLFEHNSSGLYAEWNPAITCPPANVAH